MITSIRILLKLFQVAVLFKVKAAQSGRLIKKTLRVNTWMTTFFARMPTPKIPYTSLDFSACCIGIYIYIYSHTSQFSRPLADMTVNTEMTRLLARISRPCRLVYISLFCVRVG